MLQAGRSGALRERGRRCVTDSATGSRADVHVSVDDWASRPRFSTMRPRTSCSSTSLAAIARRLMESAGDDARGDSPPGAVYFGALTYVGNAPNFMIKAIAETAGVRDAELLRLSRAMQRSLVLPLSSFCLDRAATRGLRRPSAPGHASAVARG